MANVEWLFIDRASQRSVAPGDLVSAEAGGLPVYEVVGVDAARAWVRDEATHRDTILPTEWLRWRMLRPTGEPH